MKTDELYVVIRKSDRYAKRCRLAYQSYPTRLERAEMIARNWREWDAQVVPAADADAIVAESVAAK